MTKYRIRLHGRKTFRKRSKRRTFRLRFAFPARTRKLLRPVTGCLVLAVLIAAAHLLLPDELTWQWHLLLGLIWAAVAVVIYAWATRQAGLSEEEMLYRIRRGQHADFGKRVRKAQQTSTAIRLPLVGETSYRALGGVAVLFGVAAWWLGPLRPVAPMVPKVDVVQDMTTLLEEEILAVVLVVPDGNLAIIEPPILPPRVRSLAREIDSAADPYELGLRAIAWSRFEEARESLAAAMEEKDAPVYAIQVARAQNEMYAGKFAAAAAWYAKAVQEEPNDAMAWCQMAVARMQAGEFDQAERLVSRATELCREKPAEGTLNYALVACLHVQAVLHVCLGRDYDQAVRMCLQARELINDAENRQHPFAAASLNNQAVLYLLQAEYAGAEGLNLRAGDIWTRSLGPHHPHVAASLGNLAMLRYHLGQYNEAMELLTRALAIRTQSLPEIHAIVGAACDAKAVLHLARGESDQARPLAERALTISEETLGSEHPNMVAVFDTLAGFYASRAQYTRAEQYYLRALTLGEEAWGPNHPYLVGILNHLAALHTEQGRCGKAEAYDNAEAACQRALDAATRSFGNKHPCVGTALNSRGRLGIARGQPRDARKYLEEALEIRKAAFGMEHPDVARTLAHLASLENSPRTYAKAVARYERAIETTERLLGRRHREVARLWYGLAVLHVHRGKYSEADPCLQRALAIQEETLVSYHPDLADTLELYVKLLRNLDPPEAERAAEMESRAASIRNEHAREDRLE